MRELIFYKRCFHRCAENEEMDLRNSVTKFRSIAGVGKNLAGGVSEPPGSIQIPGKRNYLDDAGTDREQVNFITCMDSLCSTKANLRLYHISKITTITAFKNCILNK